MPKNACSNESLFHKPMAHSMLFFTLIVLVTLTKLFTSTALHWFYALQCRYHSLNFQKNIFVSATSKHQDQ
jgi:acyl dehydratase